MSGQAQEIGPENRWSLLWARTTRNVDFVNIGLGVLSITAVFLLWEYAEPLNVPGLRRVPPPTEVVSEAASLIYSDSYWLGWVYSIERIFLGFFIAQLVGIPIGLSLALSRAFRDMAFPITEILRPIPPVAWLPVSILFWPTDESSIVFIVFLGALWIVLINTMGGARNVDSSLIRAAISLGSRRSDIFWRIILPATLPSILTGMTVGMGIAWEMVVAAEMIAGDTGLGYLLWLSFKIGNIGQVIVCMVSIGIAGALSSMVIRWIGGLVTPWRRSV